MGVSGRPSSWFVLFVGLPGPVLVTGTTRNLRGTDHRQLIMLDVVLALPNYDHVLSPACSKKTLREKFGRVPGGGAGRRVLTGLRDRAGLGAPRDRARPCTFPKVGWQVILAV